MKIKWKRIVVDIDNTIAMHHDNMADYTQDALPDVIMINILRQLKKNGWTIVLYTARKMNSSGNNTAKAIARGGYNTFKWLEKYDVPYDELMFGKPNGDIYLDDKSISWNREEALKKLAELLDNR